MQRPSLAPGTELASSLWICMIISIFIMIAEALMVRHKDHFWYLWVFVIKNMFMVMKETIIMPLLMVKSRENTLFILTYRCLSQKMSSVSITGHFDLQEGFDLDQWQDLKYHTLIYFPKCFFIQNFCHPNYL